MQSLPFDPNKIIRHSHFLRILLIGFLLMLLQVPIAMIQGLIWERQRTDREATEEVAGKWGREQAVVGPMLVVPFVEHETVIASDGRTSTRTRQRQAHFLPAELTVEADVKSEHRYRGIFQVPVYRAAVELQGRFRKPDLTAWQIAPEDVLWERAQLWVRISDARAIQEPTALRWNGRAVPFVAGTGDFGGAKPGIHVPLRGLLEAESFEFHFPLELNGSERLFFTPFGDQSLLRIASNWKDPSFQGNWLPAAREVGEQGFEATWRIPSLGRNYPQSWIAENDSLEPAIAASKVGVELLSPVNPYRMAERSVKYQALFLLLTFLTIWLFEVLIGVRVHPVQYMLVGAAMCLFYLLELSLSEHFGFVTAYTVAAGAVVLQIGGYCIAVLRGFRRAAVVGCVTGGLYGYLYVLLMNQDYSLLLGSLGLFLILGAVMVLTHKIDWYDPSRRD
jgi:inner membrane protein